MKGKGSLSFENMSDDTEMSEETSLTKSPPFDYQGGETTETGEKDGDRGDARDTGVPANTYMYSVYPQVSEVDELSPYKQYS